MRRVPPPRHLTLESPADVQAFRSALGRRLTPPRVRINLRLHGLPEARQSQHEQAINRLLPAHGLHEAFIGAALLLLLCLAWPLPPAGTHSGLALLAWCGQALIGAALGAIVGRWVGVWRARRQLQGACDRLLADLGSRPR